MHATLSMYNAILNYKQYNQMTRNTNPSSFLYCKNFFLVIEQEYDIKPTIVHYNYMVDLFEFGKIFELQEVGFYQTGSSHFAEQL